jgi:enoyl-CoA hydratase
VIERLVEPGEALAAATEIARQIAGKSPLAMRLAKESILRIETDELEEQYRTEWDYTNRLRGFKDSAEALAAFLEKREPNWTLS